jgi:N6-L-threonylcarbamoyladenine synthase
MDLSFSGLSTAATEALKNNTMEDVCYSFQETAFAMVVEVTERALAHTGKSEVLLAGGVGANMRLQEMLDIMCTERGASFYVPEKRFMGDNGAMIAYLGLLMYDSGNVIDIENSHVNPNFRPDEVDVTWLPKDFKDRRQTCI